MQVFRLERDGLDLLFNELLEQGYELIGPTRKDSAIVYDALKSPADLPVGWTHEQDAGQYQLKKREDEAFFGYTVGPQSWKAYLHPPVFSLYKAKREGEGFELSPNTTETPKYAFIGVRACELSAIFIQDKVFTQGDYVDPVYQARREQALVVAVNCTHADKTCFCTSMGTGPGVEAGFDLALTEMFLKGEQFFLIEADSDKGKSILEKLSLKEASREETEEAGIRISETREQMGRQLNTLNIKEMLYDNYEHPRWDEVAERCLSCANCTMVCPTCFCTTVDDLTDLTGQEAERVRRWDSCFTTDFSYIHGGSIRPSGKSRYRQWLTHKLASWEDQFGTLGCVGCGRCISWCPVGIDITQEAAAIRQTSIGEEGQDGYA